MGVSKEQKVVRAERAVSQGRMGMREYQSIARAAGYQPATKAQINKAYGNNRGNRRSGRSRR